MAETLLQVHNLSTSFRTADGVVPAVSGVSLRIDRGETVAVVGESGSGKTVTALSIIRLIAMPPGEISADSIKFDDAELTTATNDQLRQIRGNDISMIFQEPMTSLNPVMRIGVQIAEPLETHQGMTRREALARAIELLGQVGIPLPERRINEYPHQLSGGMRQRVMIAMALACQPKLLIADEPTTALDVTIQAQILELIKELKQQLNTSVLLITHDLGVVAEMADRVVVMYAGQIVEEAPAIPLFRRPWHPYTRGLMDSIPSLDEKKEHLHIIRGVVPSPMFFPKGCRFNPRCDLADERCRSQAPELVAADGGRLVRCWHALNESGVVTP